MTSTSTSNSNTMISRSKLLDISDLNSYFTSSLFLLFGTLDGGNDAIITDEDNSIISKCLVIVYQRIRSSNIVQLLFDFVTTIYLGINSNSNDDDDAAAGDGSGSIVLSPAAHLLGFGYKQTISSSSSTSSNVISSIQQQQQQQRNRRRRRRRKLQIIVYAFFRFVVPTLYEIMKRKGIDYINNKNNNKEKEEQEGLSSFSSPPLTLQLSQEHHQEKKEIKKEDGKVLIRTTKSLQQISLNRKKLILQKIIQFIDTTIPIIRLSLLLSCWNTNTKQSTASHGGNLSMFLSGLSYTNTATSANTMSSPLPIASSSLFVLYAHRRWFHREFVELFWNRIGRSMITTSSELNDMITQIYQKQKQYLLFLYKQKILRRYYKNKNKNRIIKASISNDDENENDVDDNENDDNANDCCQLCNTTNVIIPYRFIDCCQQIVCYTCLWNYIIEYNTNSNNNNNNSNNSYNNNNNNNTVTKITIPCPICYQDIQHCQPV